MRMLIAIASRHGSTQGIAARLASVLRKRGIEVDISDVTHYSGWPGGAYDAFVIGSAVYEGRWMRGARRFVIDNAVELQRSPVWLFSSGPLDHASTIGVDAHRIDDLMHTVTAREHREFAGRLDRSELGPVERWIVDAVRAHAGDFREWAEIDAWAQHIADELGALVVT